MEKITYERAEKDQKKTPQLSDDSFLLINALENLTESIIMLANRIK